jgi:D-alanyl-D-alanine carboxypeptidase
MKDSQKKKKPNKKKKNNPPDSIFSYSFVLYIFEILKKNFVWIVISITVINLILGIFIVLLIGQIKKTMITQTLDTMSVPDLPVIAQISDVPLSAEAVIVFEKDSRSVIMQKRGSLRFAPASTTKIMTALVVLEHYDTNQYLPAFGVSQIEGSKMGLVEGEEVKVIDLLYGLMLPSGNDAAHVLASNYPGGKDAFVSKMNKKAEEFRLYNTHFRDPAGLDDSNYTTAFDLARLALVALENDILKKVVETRYITVYDRTFVYEHKLENLNKLLDTEGIFGVKTGYTDEAGQVLVTSFESKGKTYIIVVLKSEDRFSDTEKVLTDVIEKIQFQRF